ncbi:hypothetical protein H7X87_01540 [Acetobacteraceae bacterium]|nr:hypothetical protein [Candidatus Parcubacteria bacterium]
MANDSFNSDGSTSGLGRSWSSYRTGIIALILLVLAGGAWYLSHNLRNAQSSVLQEQFSWTLTAATSTTGTQTAVVLRIADVDVPVGTYRGTCTVVDGVTWKLIEGELAAVICQKETGGTEIGVFSDSSGTLTLQEGNVVGTDPATAERGDFAPIVQRI